MSTLGEYRDIFISVCDKEQLYLAIVLYRDSNRYTITIKGLESNHYIVADNLSKLTGYKFYYSGGSVSTKLLDHQSNLYINEIEDLLTDMGYNVHIRKMYYRKYNE